MKEYEQKGTTDSKQLDPWWTIVGDLYHGRRIIFIIGTLAAVASVVMSASVP